jgi:plasmid stabilization system protein ParE
MDSKYQIFWSEESLTNLEDILDYLQSKWTEKEVVKFKQKLSDQLDIISIFPNLFPASQINPTLRKAVLSKQTTLFYQVDEKSIYIVYLFDTRQNPDKLK